MTRTAAGLVDTGVVAGVVGVLYGGVALVRLVVVQSRLAFPQNIGWTVPAVGAVVAVAYLSFTWWSTGRSYGKALLGLRVIGRRGRHLGALTSVVRAVGCVLFPIGLGWAILSRTNRSLADVVLGTSVVYDWTPRIPDSPTIPAAP